MYLKTAETGYTRFLLVNIFVAPTIAGTILMMELSQNEYYVKLSESICNWLSFYPQFVLTYMSSKYAQVMVNNYNWDLKTDAERRHICEYDWNPCCGKPPDASYNCAYLPHVSNLQMEANNATYIDHSTATSI